MANKTYAVTYVSNRDWKEHVVIVVADSPSEASFKAKMEIGSELHTISSKKEIG